MYQDNTHYYKVIEHDYKYNKHERPPPFENESECMDPTPRFICFVTVLRLSFGVKFPWKWPHSCRKAKPLFISLYKKFKFSACQDIFLRLKKKTSKLTMLYLHNPDSTSWPAQ